jgi:hypothetical protein
MENNEKIEPTEPHNNSPKDEDSLFWISDWHYGSLPFKKSQIREHNIEKNKFPRFKDQSNKIKQLVSGDIVKFTPKIDDVEEKLTENEPENGAGIFKFFKLNLTEKDEDLSESEESSENLSSNSSSVKQK